MPVYEGPTIDEAIVQGLHALGLEKEAVDIEILTDAKKGFLGMGKKNARVSIEPVTIEEPADTTELAEEHSSEQVSKVQEPRESVQLTSHLVELMKRKQSKNWLFT